MKRFHFLFVLLITITFSGCQKQTVKTASLFNVDSVLAHQAELLSRKHAILTKQVALHGKESETVLENLDSATWREELRIFENIESINKSVNKEAYSVVDRIGNVNNNLLTKSISTEQPLAVKLLQLHYLKSPDHLRHISAEVEHRNWMYSSSRLLDLNFQDIAQDILLVGYRIRGSQKVLLRDSVVFDIKATISLPQ